MATFCLGKPESPSSSTTKINDLPLELLLEIFYKLSIKQLHRNKIVSKQWSSIISHPSFHSQYQSRRINSSSSPLRLSLFSHPSKFLFRTNPKVPSFTLYITSHNELNCIHSKHLTKNEGNSWSMERKNSFKFLPPNSPDQKDKVHCLASSNGLLLCTTTRYLCRCLYYVCNPVTKLWITLPSPPTCVNLVLSGFVCNPNSEITRFKVVRIFTITSRSESNRKDWKLEIFDSETNQWKVFKLKLNSPILLDFKVTPIEHRGILYWECRRSNVVLAFNPNVNRVFRFKLPGICNVKVDHILQVSQDQLYYAQIDFRNQYACTCRIWRLNEFEGKRTWTNVHLLDDLYNLARQKLPNLGNYTVHWQVLGVDPMDCSTMFLCLFCSNIRANFREIYSVNIGRRKMKSLYIYYFEGNVIRSLTFVQPSWPTAVPKLPQPSFDDILYTHNHPPFVCDQIICNSFQLKTLWLAMASLCVVCCLYFIALFVWYAWRKG